MTDLAELLARVEFRLSGLREKVPEWVRDPMGMRCDDHATLAAMLLELHSDVAMVLRSLSSSQAEGR